MLSDCISKDLAVAELYIVRAAIATLAKPARDRFTQAVFSLSDSIIGLHQASLDEVLDDEDFKGLVACLGTGILLSEMDPSHDGPTFSLARLRYGKVIVATEETPLGNSFQTEVLSLLQRFTSPVIKEGYVSTCPIPPLALSSETEFEKAVMNPTTRTLSPFTAVS